MKKNIRKGFTFIELIFTIIIVGVLAVIAVRYYSNQQQETLDTHNISKMTELSALAMVKYQNESSDGYNNGVHDFTNLSPTTAEIFFDPEYFTLSGGYIIPKSFPDAKIDCLPAPVSTGTTNRTYKILFDFSGVKSARNWSDQKAKNFENKIANFYLGQKQNSRIAGAATALGSANSDLTASSINSDGIIAIQYNR